MRKLLWTVAILACLGLVIVNVRLATKLSSVQSEYDSLIDLREEKHEIIAALNPVRKESVARKQAIKRESMPVFSRLQMARELEDVAGLTGDEIVSTAVFNRADDFCIYFYVPAGNHKLAFYQHDSSPQNFDRKTATLQTIDLKSNATYEIRFTPLSTKKPNSKTAFTLSDIDGKVATRSFGFDDHASATSVRSKVRCYPSQLSDQKTHDSTIGYDGAIRELMKTGQPRLPVEIAVASFTLADKSKSLIRFFIESDAPANIPAEVAATWLRSFSEGQKVPLKSLLSNTFEPYDGSGRYNFRDDFIAERRRLATAAELNSSNQK